MNEGRQEQDVEEEGKMGVQGRKHVESVRLDFDAKVSCQCKYWMCSFGRARI